MKIKKIISSLIALSMTISMNCTTAFAIDNTTVPVQNDFVYTNEVLQTYEDWSQAGYMHISESDVPSSAIVDSLFVNGTVVNTKTGKQGYVSILRLLNGTKEIAGTYPDIMKNIDRFEIPLAGTWTIKYSIFPNKLDPHVLNNFSAKIDFTYDILAG